jgi:hypothetical protein
MCAWAVPVWLVGCAHLKSHGTQVCPKGVLISTDNQHYPFQKLPKWFSKQSGLLCNRCFFPLWFRIVLFYKDKVLTYNWAPVNTLKADSHIACCANAVPLPCCAAKGLECVFPIWFTQCGRVWFTLAMPCSDHAVLLKAMAQHSCWEMTCGLPARVQLLPATVRSSTKIAIRSIPILLTTIHTYDCKEW